MALCWLPCTTPLRMHGGSLSSRSSVRAGGHQLYLHARRCPTLYPAAYPLGMTSSLSASHSIQPQHVHVCPLRTPLHSQWVMVSCKVSQEMCHTRAVPTQADTAPLAMSHAVPAVPHERGPHHVSEWRRRGSHVPGLQRHDDSAGGSSFRPNIVAHTRSGAQ